MKKLHLFLAACTWMLFACQDGQQQSFSNELYNRIEEGNALDYVNPFIGTGGHGHTYPGVSVPFGMMQLSPDSRLDGWDGCGGYHFSDSVVYGFSHTHLSGTGVSDYGDILLMPLCGERFFNNGADGTPGYSSAFSHQNEKAEVGEYAIHLDEGNIDVRLSCTTRAGMHSYNFNEEGERNLVIDLQHRDKLLEGKIEQVDDKTIRGRRLSQAWATEQHVYFYAEFSQPIQVMEKADSSEVYLFSFGNEFDELKVRIGISSVDEEGAMKNLQTEIAHWNFEQVKSENRALWLSELNKIQVEGEEEEAKHIFYSALYHSFLNPNTFSDVDGRYRGMDLAVHELADSLDKHYTIFSLWDTYRATHPLFTITQVDRTNEFIRTFLRQYQEGGELPIWELSANYTGCMIGYHSIPVIADAYVKGIREYDVKLAAEAMMHSANNDKLGLDSYKRAGYVLSGEEPESVSKTLEYAFDDWCIGQMLSEIGFEELSKDYYDRSLNYRNVFDPDTHFMRAKLNNTWFGPFDPFEVNHHYTEANAWQYSLYVPHDVSGHIQLMGGEENYEAHLDALFTAETSTTGRDQADITGLIGQYAHGNEPSHHMAYLYNYIGKPTKTQERVDEILRTQYQNAPDGLSGNEDCGQMSSWYVMSALGMYPVAPGSVDYIIGRPLFDQATLRLENGNSLVIQCQNQSEENKYIQSVQLNFELLTSSYITHEQILKGGNLVFVMGPEPSEWGAAVEHRPVSEVTQADQVIVPFFESDGSTFSEELELKIRSTEGADLYVSLVGDIDPANWSKYEKPLMLNETSTVRAYAMKDGKRSRIIEADYYKIDGNKSIELQSTYANQYAAAGQKALIDALRGNSNYRTGKWQGYREDLSAIVDLSEERAVNSVSLGCLQDIKSWIWYPTQVEILGSVDGENFETLGVVMNEFPDREYGAFHRDFTLSGISGSFRYIHVKAKNYGVCPDWHLGAGGVTWLFVDEIVVE